MTEPDPYLKGVTDPECRAMRAASGRVDDDRPLVSFLYLLGRDRLALGTVEDLLKPLNGTVHFTNGWLADWARYTADRLHSERDELDLAHRVIAALLDELDRSFGSWPRSDDLALHNLEALTPVRPVVQERTRQEFEMNAPQFIVLEPVEVPRG